MILADDSTAFQQFSDDSFDSNGKHKHTPVPEPSFYGMIFIMLTLAVVLVFKRRRKMA